METEAAASSQAEGAAISTTQAVAEATTAPQNTSNAQAAEEEQMSLAEARKLRKEHQSLRDRLAEAEAKAKQFEQAQMSEEEKRTARLQELEQENTRLQATAKRAALNAAITDEAVKAGIKPALAQKLISQDEVSWEGDVPKNVAKLLESIVKDNPELAGTVAGGGAANPGRGGADNPAAREAELRALLTGQTFNPFGLENAKANPVVIRSG
jgi:flagellar biosynthesis GTPase FlhF